MKALAIALGVAFAIIQSVQATDAAERAGDGVRGGGFRGGEFRGGFVGGYRGPRVGVYLGGVYDPFWPFFPYYYYPYYPPYYGYPYPEVIPEALPPTAAAPAQTPAWYYCDDPQGYYPYVRTCNHGWQVVPASPPANAG
jgi:hypothetical protein